MNIISHNVLNNHFSLEYYILSTKLPNFLDYAKEEKIDINYICFISDINEIDYIITTDYRLITIKSFDNIIENSIIDSKRHGSFYVEYTINYENIVVYITKPHINPNDLFIKLDKTNPLFLTNKLVCKVRTQVAQNNIVDLGKHVFSKDININSICISKIIFSSSDVLSIFGDRVFDSICFSKYFNEKIYILPNAYTIIFNSQFNTLLKPRIIPKITKKIVLGVYYNHCIKFDNIEELVLGNNYNLPLQPNSLPNLKKLVCGAEYDQPFTPNIFPKLETLILGNNYRRALNLPATIKCIYVPQYYKNLHIDNGILNNKIHLL